MQRGKAYDSKLKAAHDYDHESRRICQKGRTGSEEEAAKPPIKSSLLTDHSSVPHKASIRLHSKERGQTRPHCSLNVKEKSHGECTPGGSHGKTGLSVQPCQCTTYQVESRRTRFSVFKNKNDCEETGRVDMSTKAG